MHAKNRTDLAHRRAESVETIVEEIDHRHEDHRREMGLLRAQTEIVITSAVEKATADHQKADRGTETDSHAIFQTARQTEQVQMVRIIGEAA